MYSSTDKSRPIVQKYGGTSVGNVGRIKDIAARTRSIIDQGFRNLAIVVSAQAGETNRLVELIKSVHPTTRGPAYDMALAAGEQVSVALTAAALESVGVPAVPLLAYQIGIVTDRLHGKARIQHIRIAPIHDTWAKGAIPVIAGFQGVTEDMTITTLGRGGSDTSAVAIAVALNAAFCEINTDVDGLFTSDPRIVKNARLINACDYETALEMASLGSKVLHPRCVELGAKYDLPITVRNTFTEDHHPHTLISKNHRDRNLLKVSTLSQSGTPTKEPLRHMSDARQGVNQKPGQSPNDQLEALAVTGVTTDRDVAKITISGLDQRQISVAEIFKTMGELGINVDIIIFDRDVRDSKSMRLGFTVAASDVDRASGALKQLAQERGDLDLEVASETGLAKISAVGVGMRSYSGVAGRTFAALARSGIDVRMTSTSEIKISVVVEEKFADAATNELHKEFLD